MTIKLLLTGFSIFNTFSFAYNEMIERPESYQIVLAGDSIAEGHPGTHGPLHKGELANVPGQLSYFIEKALNKSVYNAGFGGNTSFQLRNRWQAILDLHPEVIALSVGINDVFQGLDPKDNYNFFAESCKSHGIKLFMLNIGAHRKYDDEKQANAAQINEYLATTFQQKFPEVEIIDYLGWSTGGTYQCRKPAAGFFHDAVHPNKTGYEDLSKIVIEKIEAYYRSDNRK